MINMAYCCLILLGKVIQKLVFGKLRVIENQVRFKALFTPISTGIVLWCIHIARLPIPIRMPTPTAVPRRLQWMLMDWY